MPGLSEVYREHGTAVFKIWLPPERRAMCSITIPSWMGTAQGAAANQIRQPTPPCANEQDKFWEMHSILYANWNGENQGAFSSRRLQAMAESLGLDMDAFNSCFSANKYESEIQADFDLGGKWE